MKRLSSLLVVFLGFAWIAGCLNPRPEDFPSHQPVNSNGGEAGEGDGMTPGFGDMTTTPPSEDPSDEPEPSGPGDGDDIGAADAGAPLEDAGPRDAEAAASAD